MALPNLDTRRIKRIENTDLFTIDPRRALDDPMICNHCATQRCKIRNYMSRHVGEYELHVKGCRHFTPVLAFSVLEGLDGKFWNTIRVGAAWGDRLLPGKEVAVVDTRERRLRGYRSVVKTHVATLEEIVQDHAHLNHALVSKEYERGETDCTDRMMRILKNAYGTNIASPDRKATAIYLRDDG